MQYDELEKQNGRRLTLRQKAFFSSEDASAIQVQLKRMLSDPVYNTAVSYSDTVCGRNFVDKHLLYLSLHPNVSPQYYVANLRLKSKIRI